jgi:GNAT superfamily N-acetyltransferase
LPSSGSEPVSGSPRLVWCSCGRQWISPYTRPVVEPCPRCRRTSSHVCAEEIAPELASVISAIERALLADDGATMRSGWITSPQRKVRVYARLTQHLVTSQDSVALATTFDIASIELEPECQGKGYFRHLLRFINANCYSRSGVYVENVMNPRFLKYFTDRPIAWRPVPGVKLCFYQQFP